MPKQIYGDELILEDSVTAAKTLAELADKSHASLTGVTADQHHAQAHTLTSHSTRAHSELTDVGANDHHAQAHTLASHTTKPRFYYSMQTRYTWVSTTATAYTTVSYSDAPVDFDALAAAGFNRMSLQCRCYNNTSGQTVYAEIWNYTDGVSIGSEVAAATTNNSNVSKGAAVDISALTGLKLIGMRMKVSGGTGYTIGSSFLFEVV